MNTILFDIDGTLVHAGGAGLQAIQQAMSRLFDVDDFPAVVLHGRTDMAILTELFAYHRRDYRQHRAAFDREYHRRLPEVLTQLPGQVLPGVRRLLRSLQARPDVALGIVTGNGRLAAEAKLAHFGLQEYFEFGGFGDVHIDRNDVARMALQAAATRLNGKLVRDQVWVIGDTVNDIRCARAIGARVVAVETGGVGADVLRAAGPELVVRDLSDTDQLLETLVNSKNR